MDVNAPGAKTGLNWTDAYKTIQAALADPCDERDRNALIGETLGSLGSAGGFLIEDSAISQVCPDNAFCTNVQIAGILGLGPLQNDGGLTETMLPGEVSVAIDSASTMTCSTTDQRGVARSQDSNLDGESRYDM